MSAPGADPNGTPGESSGGRGRTSYAVPDHVSSLRRELDEMRAFGGGLGTSRHAGRSGRGRIEKPYRGGEHGHGQRSHEPSQPLTANEQWEQWETVKRGVERDIAAYLQQELAHARTKHQHAARTHKWVVKGVWYVSDSVPTREAWEDVVRTASKGQMWYRMVQYIEGLVASSHVPNIERHLYTLAGVRQHIISCENMLPQLKKAIEGRIKTLRADRKGLLTVFQVKVEAGTFDREVARAYVGWEAPNTLPGPPWVETGPLPLRGGGD